MISIENKKDVEDLISNAVAEDSELEYKAAPAIEDKSEIGKDVSAMANAAGGIIIYGIVEIENKPTGFDPITNKTREFLDQVIASQVRPKLNCEILPIDVPGGVIYVLKISQGETAYQAKKDYRYHRRRNTTTEWMEDYEIRDVMNRSKHPDVEFVFRVKDQQLWPYLKNDADILAKDVRYCFEIPTTFTTESWTFSNMRDNVKYYVRDAFLTTPIHGKAEVMILPAISLESQIKNIVYYKWPDKKVDALLIYWKVWADNAPVREGSLNIRDVTVLDFNSY